MLCSFLIPSRYRFDQLLRTVQSVFDISNSDDFEIIVRLHNDDDASLERAGELLAFPRTSYFTGATYSSYQSLHIFTAELIEVAAGEWCAELNDDMVLFREGGISWETQLRAMPKDALVQPEIHRLNESHYRRDPSSSAPIHANDKALATMLRASGTPEIDLTLYKYYVEHGWPVRFLEGIGFWHQWKGVQDHATA